MTSEERIDRQLRLAMRLAIVGAGLGLFGAACKIVVLVARLAGAH